MVAMAAPLRSTKAKDMPPMEYVLSNPEITTSNSFARLVAAEDASAMGAGAVVTEVEGLPESPYIPESTVNVIVPAVVPVENTMFGCALSVMAVAPALTANDATRVDVATNRTAASSVTAVTDGLKVRVMLPAA